MKAIDIQMSVPTGNAPVDKSWVYSYNEGDSAPW